MAPKLMKKQVNNDVSKKTLIDKPRHCNATTMARLSKLIQSGKLDIVNIDALSASELRKIGRELKLKELSKKSNIALLEELKTIVKVFVAGQGIYS